MNISAILPQSILAMMSHTKAIDEELVHADDSSITDSVRLLMERRPQLFNRKVQEDKEEDDEIDATYFSKTEYQLPLKATIRNTKTSAPRRKMRTRRLPDGSFGRVPVDTSPLDLSDEEEEAAIGRHAFGASESVPPKVVLVPRAA